MKKLLLAIATIGLLASPAAFAVTPVPLLPVTLVCTNTSAGKEVVRITNLDSARAEALADRLNSTPKLNCYLLIFKLPPLPNGV